MNRGVGWNRVFLSHTFRETKVISFYLTYCIVFEYLAIEEIVLEYPMSAAKASISQTIRLDEAINFQK